MIKIAIVEDEAMYAKQLQISCGSTRQRTEKHLTSQFIPMATRLFTNINHSLISS